MRAEKLQKENLEKTIQKLKFTHTQAAKTELKKLEEQAQMLIQKRYGGESQAGVTYHTFRQYCKLLSQMDNKIKTSIIQAFGIDIRA